MAKILIVEDDLELCDHMRTWLDLDHHVLDFAHKGSQGMLKLQVSSFDIVVLDWELPELSGVEICKKFRAEGGKTPVLMLTGKGTMSDKEAGFEAGADDYLTKPFNMKELCLRVQALLRRSSNFTDTVLKVRDITLDPKKFKVVKGGEEVRLLPKEFALLQFLMRHPDEIFSAEAILERVWISETEATPEAVVTCLRRLRKKIDIDENSPLIRTIHGVGYRLES
jgi:DNA-binding response OmpR family regulator